MKSMSPNSTFIDTTLVRGVFGNVYGIHTFKSVAGRRDYRVITPPSTFLWQYLSLTRVEILTKPKQKQKLITRKFKNIWNAKFKTLPEIVF